MPAVFPSGLTDCLGLPLSLYSSSYSGDNIYNRTARYNWKIDLQKHALPVGRAFYDDIFANVRLPSVSDPGCPTVDVGYSAAAARKDWNAQLILVFATWTGDQGRDEDV